MYAHVWNRVGLLAAGLAAGWNLVNYWCVADAARAFQLVKLLLGLAGGLVIVLLLAMTSLDAALAGLMSFLCTALVGYAANAKQVSRASEILKERVQRPSGSDGRLAVLLLARGEPSSYDGPEPWARRLSSLALRGESVPHWLVRARTLARIRAAYRAMGGENPANRSVAQLAQELGRRLGPAYLVREAFLDTAPLLASALARLAEAGMSRVLIVPLVQDIEGAAEMHAQIAQSRGREAGLWIRSTPSFAPSGWPTGADDSRLRALCRGEPLSPPAPASDAALEAIRVHLMRVLAALEPGRSPSLPERGEVAASGDV